MGLHKTVIKAIDRRRRAFFWTGEDACHGSKCLVAWEHVCTSKLEGGLGLKDLQTQNRCLLLKFVDKLFTGAQAPWKDWLLLNDSVFSDNLSSSPSYLWKIICDELSTYRSITSVDVRDGSSTSFWHDRWLTSDPLAILYPALFSHSVRPNISVQQVFQDRFDLRLRPRLTAAAAAELASLMSALQEVRLQEGQDVRRLTSTGKPFKSRDAYDMLAPSPSLQDFHGRWIWGSKVPNKVKIFAWLYFKNRLSTKANLFDKNVMEDAICGRCAHPSEDRCHVFFDCKLSKDVWLMLGIRSLSTAADNDVWALPSDCHQDPATWPSVLLTILWRLWDARNGAIFWNERHLPQDVIIHVCDDLIIWEGRFSSASMIPGLRQWRVFLRSCVNSNERRSLSS
jgi:hypothetical protein